MSSARSVSVPRGGHFKPALFAGAASTLPFMESRNTSWSVSCFIPTWCRGISYLSSSFWLSALFVCVALLLDGRSVACLLACLPGWLVSWLAGECVARPSQQQLRWVGTGRDGIPASDLGFEPFDARWFCERFSNGSSSCGAVKLRTNERTSE